MSVWEGTLGNPESPVILHLANDEKFINTAFHLFEEAFPVCNRCVIIKPPADPPLKYVKKREGIVTAVTGKGAYERMVTESEMADAVILHGVDSEKGAALLTSRNKEKFAGIIFGSELYNERMAGNDYLKEKTRRLEQFTQETRPVDWIRKVYRAIAYRNSRQKFEDIELRQVFADLSWFGTHSSESLDKWMERNIISKDAETFHFSYFPIEQIVPDREMRVKGNAILLGNSAAPTNNHIEALELLKEAGIGDRTVISPLSYGNERYAEIIRKEGHRMFADRFEPVDRFLSLDEYTTLISRCEIVIMNHLRSQALGTSLAAVWLGAKVFLNDTEAYRYLRSIGCRVFLIEESLSEHLQVTGPLDIEAAERNRQALLSKFSEEVLVNEIRCAFRCKFNFV